jgi:hypothetical protein
MALRRGVRGAIASTTCAPCRNRQHAECQQEDALIRLAAQREMKADGFAVKDPEVQVPFCRCYSESDIHL